MFDAIHLFRKAIAENTDLHPEVIIPDEYSQLKNLPLTPDELVEMSAYDAEGRAAAREMEAGQGQGSERVAYQVR